MKYITLRLTVGAAIVASGLTTAGAADLGGGSLKDYVSPPPPPQYSLASWYIRGDGGYSWHDQPTVVERAATFETDNVRNKWDNTFTAGGGLGYYFSPHWRADLTVDYRFDSDFHTTNGDRDNHDFIPGARSFKISNTVGLANIYYDFGNRSHFSPYIGAGIGVTENRTSSGTIKAFDSSVNPTGGAITGSTKTDLALAVMAGFTQQIRQNLFFDAGYRFLYLGEAKTGAVTGNFVNGAVPPQTVAGGTNGMTINDLHAHEVRVGLRYDFGGR